MAPVPTGEFNGAQQAEIDRAIRNAETVCRYEFSVYVGAAQGEPRAYARQLHAALANPARSVMLLVDPAARRLEVVTGEVVRRTLSDEAVRLAVAGMQSSFAAGDVVGGVKHGVAQLADGLEDQLPLRGEAVAAAPQLGGHHIQHGRAGHDLVPPGIAQHHPVADP